MDQDLPPDFEDVTVREVRQPSSMPEGKSVIKIKKNRRWVLPTVAALILILFLLLLISGGGGEPEEGVSLKAAREVILKEQPPLQKEDVLNILSREGFLVAPGRPQGKLEIAVAVRREGITLRGGGSRELILWEDFKKP